MMILETEAIKNRYDLKLDCFTYVTEILPHLDCIKLSVNW